MSDPMDFNKVFHKKRIVIVFAGSEKDPAFITQMEAFQAADAGMTEREVAVITITSRAPPTYFLRKKYNSRDDKFLAVLIGKDGKVKEVVRKPFQTVELFEIIDAMPMRKEEMK